MADNILVWVVDDDESIRWVLEKGLSEHNIDVEVFESAHKVVLKLELENPDLILTDIKCQARVVLIYWIKFRI